MGVGSFAGSVGVTMPVSTGGDGVVTGFVWTPELTGVMIGVDTPEVHSSLPNKRKAELRTK